MTIELFFDLRKEGIITKVKDKIHNTSDIKNNTKKYYFRIPHYKGHSKIVKFLIECVP